MQGRAALPTEVLGRMNMQSQGPRCETITFLEKFTDLLDRSATSHASIWRRHLKNNFGVE